MTALLSLQQIMGLSKSTLQGCLGNQVEEVNCVSLLVYMVTYRRRLVMPEKQKEEEGKRKIKGLVEAQRSRSLRGYGRSIGYALQVVVGGGKDLSAQH